MSRGRTSWRFNAWLSAALLLAILVVANGLAREHLAWRVDCSEDGLYTPSPVGKRLVEGLEDHLRVEAFFSGEVRLGPVQIAKRRLTDQLEELRDDARGRIELVFEDPNASSEARVSADRFGIRPVPLKAVQGTSLVSQDVYLGLVLRYRERERVIPFVLPQEFEFVFLSALSDLTRPTRGVVGFLVDDGTGKADDPFQQARRLLTDRFTVLEVLDLDRGEDVPPSLDVLVVARPRLAARSAAAVDRYLQGGGRALFLCDRTVVDLARGALTEIEDGCSALFEAWGLALSEKLAWDQLRSNTIRTALTTTDGTREVRVQFPYWVHVDQDGVQRELPATARVPGCDLFWSHAVLKANGPVAGLECTTLLESSPQTWLVSAVGAAIVDPNVLSSKGVALLAQGGERSYPLAVALRGPLPSAFGDGTSETQVVVVGDSDWVSDGKFFTTRNELLFQNLVDWLAQEDELLALRSRLPVDRKIDDFLEAERLSRGLATLVEIQGSSETSELLSSLEAEAADAARRRRWLHMAAGTGGGLAAAFVALFAFRALLTRP